MISLCHFYVGLETNQCLEFEKFNTKKDKYHSSLFVTRSFQDGASGMSQITSSKIEFRICRPIICYLSDYFKILGIL